MQWFYKLNRFLQVLLLLIPFVNWIMEILLRANAFSKSKQIHSIVMLVLAIIPITGVVIGWVDLFCVLFTKHLFLE